MKNRIMLLLTCLFMSIGLVTAQTSTVKGLVTSEEDGEPVVGASVLVEGTTLGAVTDIDGKFLIPDVPHTAKTIRVSYIGLQSQSLPIRRGVSMHIVLKTDAALLDEVMVVAYGTAKRSSFTGSAAQVNNEKIDAHVSTSVTSALAGNTPGVQYMATNGDPTSNAPTIRIRGIGSMSASNAPLYVVDGVPYDGPLNAINPQDVESMTVLKDASANAIYGARGANGVILITTKKGRKGDAEVKFDAKWGSNSRLIPQYDVITNPAEYYETVYKKLFNSRYYNGSTLADSYAYADRALLDKDNGGLGYLVYTLPEGESLIGRNFKLNPKAKLGYSDGEYYYQPDDWYDESFHSSFRQEYNVSTSGATERMNFYASAGYLQDGGIVNNSELKRYTARTNVDYQIKSWIKVATSMSYTHTDSSMPSYDTSSLMSSGNLFYIVNNMGPIYPLYVRNADGSIMRENGRIVYDSNQTNQARPSVIGNAVRDNEYNSSKTYRDVLSGKWTVSLTPVKGLTLTANLGANVDNMRSNYLYSQFASSNATDGSAWVYHTRQFGINTQYLANYKVFIAEKHNIDLLAGYEQYKYKYQYLYGGNDHLYNPMIGELNNATGTSNRSLGSYTDNYMTEGFLARAQYDYDEKYFISASYRRDASSRFAKGHRWGNFGSVGAAWLINKEAFMSDVRWIDELKLKASYGVQGNDNLTADYNSFAPYADIYTASYNEATGEYAVTLVQKGNENLTWETSHAFNIGVDFSIFKGRLSGTLEYFSRKTSDLLYHKPTPLSSGIVTGQYPTNIGTIMNKGFEINLDGILYRNRNIELGMNVNLSHYKNEITALDPSVAENGIRGSYYIYKVGGSLYQAYCYKYAGVNDEGRALYYKEVTEVKNEGTPNETKETHVETTTSFAEATQFDCGTTLPDLYGGLGLTFKAYGFDLSAQCSFQLGGKIYDGTYQALMWTSSQSIGQALHKDVLKAWTPENTSSNIPRWDGDTSIGQSSVDRFFVSSDYLSLNNVTLGYTFSRSQLKHLGLGSLRIYVAGENLAVATARKGLDPRFSLGTGNMVSGAGSSTNYYSAMRTVTAGLTITF